MSLEEEGVVNFQAAASQQGREFEELVTQLLRNNGWLIVGRNVFVHGVEVDIVAIDPDGVEWWVECKGSHRGKTPGSKRGDTVKKAVGVAAYLSIQEDRRPYMLVTSHLPTPGTVAALMLDAAMRAGWFNRVQAAGLVDMSVDVVDDIGDDNETDA